MLPVREHVKQVFEERERPELAALIDDTVADHFGLTPPEVKTLCAVLLAEGGNILAAFPLTGLKQGMYQGALASLEAKGLVEITGGTVSVAPMQQQLRVLMPDEAEQSPPTEPLARKVVLRPIAEQVVAMMREARNPAAGLARVYAFVFGQPSHQLNFATLGKIVNAFGDGPAAQRRAALFLLSKATEDLGPNPLAHLLPLAIGYGKVFKDHGFRPDSAPDPDELREAFSQADESNWKARLRRWQVYALQGWTSAPTQEQAEADQRQYRADIARWERENGRSWDATDSTI